MPNQRPVFRSPKSMGSAVAALLVIAVLNGGALLRAQGFTAEILGTVTDSAQSVVPQAIVTAVNKGTGQKTSGLTDTRGSYTIPALPPGQYTVTVEMAGFKRLVREPVTLQVDQRLPLDFQLELGEVSQSVAVTSEVEAIQTETATVGGVVTNAETSELPLNGRNFLQLNLLVPGASTTVNGSQFSTQGGGMEVHGMPENSNFFWIDGMDNTTQIIGQYIVNIPAFSIEEFRVMSPTYDAEFGRTPGGNTNLITRSGGNSYHGDLYLFIRNSIFDAKNFFDPAGNIPVFRRGQFGGDAGGRLVKDKVFFYVAAEGLTYAQGESALNVVPTHQETLGDFSDTTQIIKDPTTGLPFPMNIIPQYRLDKTGLQIAAFYPAPNTGKNTLLVSPKGTNSDDVYLTKGDWVISAKDRFSIRWAYEDLNYINPISTFSANTNIPGFGLDQNASHHYDTGLDETHIFSSNLIGNIRYGWNRYSFNYFPYAGYQDWCTMLSIQGCDEGQANWNMPAVSLNSVYSALGGTASQTEPRPQDTTFVDPLITWIKGRHTLKVGGEYRHFFMDFGNGQGPRGTFTFNGKWTGNPLADLLLGLPYQATKTVIANMPNDGFFFETINGASAYVQDDYKLSSKLTLNVGLRYEYSFPATEARDKFANLFMPNGVTSATLQVEGAPGVGNMYNSYTKQIAPRFGFAWAPKDKWVVRGGYGIFYQLILGNTPQGLHYTVPFSSTYTIVGNGTTINTDNALVSGLVANVPAFSALSYNMKNGMVQQFSLGFQHELPLGIVLDTSYVGTRGKHIDMAENFNTPVPGPGAVQARRPNPTYAAITIFGPATSSEYDGLEVRLEKRLSKGLQILSSYTWARSFDNAGTPQDPRNEQAQWGPSLFDMPSHLAVSFTYRLPVGKGEALLSHMNYLGQTVLGGWQLNGIYQYHSGLPFTPILATDNTNTLINQDRPNLIGDPYQSTATCQTRTPTCWVNAAAFATPALYTFGTAGTNEVRGPGFTQMDFALAKNFPIGEKFRLQFRAEAFNIFNNVNFNNPATKGIAQLTSSFGVITTAQPSRQMQFGARLMF
jgi:hypothetical protein